MQSERIEPLIYIQISHHLLLSLITIDLMKRVVKKSSDSNIFIQQRSNDDKSSRDRDSQSFQGVPYLKRGDSNIYIEQFLGKDQPPPLSPIKSEINVLIPPPAPPVVHEQPKEENAHSEHQQSDECEQHSQHVNPSAFHNFQKHLTVGLKHAVVFKQQDKQTKDYVRVAVKLWKAFTVSKICTKKILHFLLGDKNQHQITAEDLRQFGFAKIYDSFGDKLVREARIFLMQQVLRQIKQQNCLQLYFQHKKIKDKQKFKKYVSMFVEELQSGFLRKRLPREKVAQLIK